MEEAFIEQLFELYLRVDISDIPSPIILEPDVSQNSVFCEF